MRYFISKRIHACFASCSSNDTTIYKEIQESEISQFETYGKTISEKFDFTVFYFPSDKTFYKRGLKEGMSKHYQDTQEFKDVVQKYISEGWEVNSQNVKWLKEQYKKQCEYEDQIRKENRIKEGYVIAKWSSDLKPEDYKGGFSEEIMNEPYLKKYLEDGGCHGYIGHSVRKTELDKYIEEKFLSLEVDDKTTLPKLLATWLTSTHGRHFADSLEVETFEEQKQIIDFKINIIYNKAFIFSLPEHEGTLESTEKLEMKYASSLL